MTDLKAGDVVKLKSGSHAMTVTSRIDNFSVNCTWAANDEIKTAVIKSEALEISDPTKSPSARSMGELGRSLA